MSKRQPIEKLEEIAFSCFRFNLKTETLTNEQGTIELPPKPSKILALLLLNPGKLVTRDEIIESVWPGQVVDFDQNINFCIKQIREKLNDNSRAPEFVETVPKKGYRFLAEVQYIATFKKPTARVFLPAVAAVVIAIGLIGIWLLNNQSNSLPEALAQDIKRGIYLIDQGGEKNRQLSQSLFERLIQEHKDLGQAYAGLVLVNLYQSQTNEQRNQVKNYLSSADKHAPNDALTLLAKAKVAFYYDWNTAKAFDLFQQADEAQPNTVMILHDLAVVAAILGKMDVAEQAIERILEVDPGRFQEHYHAGWFYQVAEKYDLALKQCSESLELVPEHAYSLMCAGRAAFKLQLLQTASHYFKQYLQLANVAEAEVKRIIDDVNNGQVQSFNDWYVNWLETHQSDAFALALAYGEQGEVNKALAALEDAVKARHFMVPTAFAFDELSDVRKDQRFNELMHLVTR